MTQSNTQIVILGAGYAGMMAALRLSGKTRKLGASITLINGVDSFIQRPRLHQSATGQNVPQTPISRLLRGTRVQFLQGWVLAFDPKERQVTVRTAEGVEQVSYDYLVYALGSVVDQDSVPGVRDHTFVLDPRGSNTVNALHQKLEALSRTGGQVVVVDGGGKARGAAIHPVHGRQAVVRFLLGVTVRFTPPGAVTSIVQVNGLPALLVRDAQGAPAFVVSIEAGAGKIHSIWVTANPDKLKGLATEQ